MTLDQLSAAATDLLPCPFCGNAPLIEDGANDRPWVVQCINRDCHAQPFMDHSDTKRQALKAWNQRTGQLVAVADEVQAAYQRGRLSGRVDGHISEGRWWRFGVMCGIGLSALVWSFWP